jgi:hypothetical protein
MVSPRRPPQTPRHCEMAAHIAPACAGFGEGSDHFGSYVRSFFLYFCKRLFPILEPMTSWSQGSSFTAAPRDTTMPQKCGSSLRLALGYIMHYTFIFHCYLLYSLRFLLIVILAFKFCLQIFVILTF